MSGAPTEVMQTSQPPSTTPVLSPRSFIPLVASMFAVFGAMLAQQVVIDVAQKWRER